MGLIDRKGRVHLGSVSLEQACASRQLRAIDNDNNNNSIDNDNNNNDGDKTMPGSWLSVPTYGGEPHRDVLLGFFGSSTDNNNSEENIAKTLELARPIFADPNVIGLVENSGYDLIGWKPSQALEPSSTSSSSQTMLGKPIPPPPRKKKASSLVSATKTILGLLVFVLATVLAWSVVAGGLHLLPTISVSVNANGNTSFSETAAVGLQTLQGHVLVVYDSAMSWYYGDAVVWTEF